jgi:DNA invertase Pin-like site-specific DNA recombinase
VVLGAGVGQLSWRGGPPSGSINLAPDTTGGQELSSQRMAILDYAHNHRFQIDEFFEMQASSRKSLKERGIDALLAALCAGDLILVSELSRIGRSVGQIIQIVDKLVKNKIRFIAIKENIHLDGKQDIQSKMMVTMFSLFAEIEHDLISERTCEGLVAARAKGRVLGRPKGSRGPSRLDGKEAEIQMLLSKKVSKTSIAKIMDVSRSALLYFIDSRNIH